VGAFPFLALIPLALWGLVWLAGRLSEKLSGLQITDDGVVIRNVPGRTQRFPLALVDRFDQVTRTWSGALWSSDSAKTVAVLLLTDGGQRRVRALGDPAAGSGLAGVNNRLSDARRRSTQTPST
jgi:hypothetical protein